MFDKDPLDPAAADSGWRRTSPQKSLAEVHGDRTTTSAMSPFVKSTTDQDSFSNNVVKGGFLFPLAVEQPAGWSMGLMTKADLFRDVRINLGVTDRADDLDPFVGLAWRF